jgi:hypothetical protein
LNLQANSYWLLTNFVRQSALHLADRYHDEQQRTGKSKKVTGEDNGKNGKTQPLRPPPSAGAGYRSLGSIP